MKTDLSLLTACHECDLLVQKPESIQTKRLVCPRCGGIVSDPKPDSSIRTLALCVTALLFYVPANFLPIINLDILGHQSFNTIFSAMIAIYQGGLPAVALMVFFTSMLAPLISICLLLIVVVSVEKKIYFSGLPHLFRLYTHMDSWAMLEVYMIAVLVAVIKLVDMARVHAGLGLVCFTGLMLAYIGSKLMLDRSRIWQGIEKLQTESKGGGYGT